MSIEIYRFVERCKNEFMLFMGIDKMPDFEIVPIKISKSQADSRGYGVIARQLYDVTTGNQKLEIWEDLYKPQLNGKYLVFHELTHMLDAEKYSQCNKIKNVANKGYTEYHAAQVDLLCLLGAKSFTEDINFSMQQEIDTSSGRKKVIDYVLSGIRTAKSLIARQDFPADVATLATTLGLIFNFWGRSSICKMYAMDYQEYSKAFNDMAEIRNFFGDTTYQLLCSLAQSRLDDIQVMLMDKVYLNMIIEKSIGLS